MIKSISKILSCVITIGLLISVTGSVVAEEPEETKWNYEKMIVDKNSIIIEVVAQEISAGTITYEEGEILKDHMLIKMREDEMYPPKEGRWRGCSKNGVVAAGVLDRSQAEKVMDAIKEKEEVYRKAAVMEKLNEFVIAGILTQEHVETISEAVMVDYRKGEFFGCDEIRENHGYEEEMHHEALPVD